MAFVKLLGGGTVPATLHLTSEAVTFPALGVPVEVPEGYLPTLLNRELTRPLVIALHTEEAIPAPLVDEDAPPDETPPAAPKKGGRKSKEA